MPPVSESLPTLLSYSLWSFSIVTFSIVVEPYSYESWLLIVRHDFQQLKGFNVAKHFNHILTNENTSNEVMNNQIVIIS